MTLGAFFRGEGIELFAALPPSVLTLRMPRLLDGFENPRSVVFAAIPYCTKDRVGANLARFARVRDYHAYAKDLGERAIACLCLRYPDLTARAFADHSPFDEVLGAAAAGIGILGDNRLLITEKYSSYVFLFSLVTDLPVEEIAAEGIPVGDGEIKTCHHCGACRLACPGSCIGADRVTCASAISQKKGALSPEEIEILKKSTAAWGCDACAEACPYTKSARERGTLYTPIPYFGEHVLGGVTPADIERMTDEEYRSYAFGWRKKDVLIRNLTLWEGRE